MSATTTSPVPDRGREPSERAGFVPLLHAEWTKFRTVRGWVLGMILAAVLMDVISLLGGANGESCSSCASTLPIGPGGEAVSDSFYFLHQPLTGDGSITVRMTSLSGQPLGSGTGASAAQQAGVQPWSKAGIIIKASPQQGSAYAAMMVTGGHGVRMQYDYTADFAGLPGSASPTSPRWLRLVRTGNTITGYDSANGLVWTQVGAAGLAAPPSTLQVGLFAASPNAQATTGQTLGTGSGLSEPTLATGVFDHVTLSGGREGGAWAGTAIGSASAQPQIAAQEGYRATHGGFTVTGSGDIVPVLPGGDVKTIDFYLTGGDFAGLMAIVVIAALAMTAEYRRGMIRITLSAAPRRGRVLAAKAIVLGLITFVAGLPATLIVVTVGIRLSHERGAYVLPVPWTTEVRVIVGTAALLGLAAVLALAIGAIVRRGAVAVALVIVGIVLPYVLAAGGILPLGAAEWLLRVTPAAAFSIQDSIPQYPQATASYTPPTYLPLAPWTGFAVLCGYAAAAMALAILLLRRRDA